MRIEGSVPAFEPAAGAKPVAETAENRELIHAVRAINASGTQAAQHELVFFLDRQTGRPVIKLVDRVSKDVLLQIPNERVLRLAEDLKIPEDGR
jgi:uncharacterized FlaG/YvyC family protein